MHIKNIISCCCTVDTFKQLIILKNEIAVTIRHTCRDLRESRDLTYLTVIITCTTL